MSGARKVRAKIEAYMSEVGKILVKDAQFTRTSSYMVAPLESDFYKKVLMQFMISDAFGSSLSIECWVDGGDVFFEGYDPWDGSVVVSGMVEAE